jgi:hypothetical protein
LATFSDFLLDLLMLRRNQVKIMKSNGDLALCLLYSTASCPCRCPLFLCLVFFSFVILLLQHSAAAWYHLVSFALAKENNDYKAAAALLQDAVITVPRCLALRLMSVFFTWLPVLFDSVPSSIKSSGTATF